jgi:hypothetical protein
MCKLYVKLQKSNSVNSHMYMPPQRVCASFLFCVQPDIEVGNLITAGATHAKLCIEVHHKHAHRFFTKPYSRSSYNTFFILLGWGVGFWRCVAEKVTDVSDEHTLEGRSGDLGSMFL